MREDDFVDVKTTVLNDPHWTKQVIIKFPEFVHSVKYNKKGQLSCENGPAIIWASAGCDYWIDDVFLTEQEFFNQKLNNLLL